MKVTEICAACLYDKQAHATKDEAYLKEVREIIARRGEDDSAPYLVYLFNQVHERRFGKSASYGDVKKKYNDLVLAKMDEVRLQIEQSVNPIETALAYARVGNYIDFGAMNAVDEDAFLTLLEEAEIHERDRVVIADFLQELKTAKSFLLVADNCGEIVLDKLFLEQLKKRYPDLAISVLVRGGETLNDVTMEDAAYVRLDEVAQVISNGSSVAGTVYRMLSTEAKKAIDAADVILAKGQGNYETMSGLGRTVYYSFLCKCELFTSRFDVPKLTGMLVKEKGNGKLYGVGVGAGSPDMLTLRAVQCIKTADYIGLPHASKDKCRAYQIAILAVPELADKECICMDFKMTQDVSELEQIHRRIYQDVQKKLAAGKTIAFLTIGDPTIFSTFTYMLKRAKADGFPVEIVGGVTAFSAIAASLEIALCEGNEELHIGTGQSDIESLLALPGTKIIMKSGKNYARIKGLLREYEQTKGAKVYAVSDCGLPSERRYYGVEQMPDTERYMTTIVVKES